MIKQNKIKNELEMEKIYPERFYSPRELVKLKVVPWNSAMTFGYRLKEQQWINIFKPMVEKKGKRNYTHIQGSNVLDFMALASQGKIKIN